MSTITGNVREQESSTKNYGAAIAVVLVAVVFPILAIGYYAYISLSGPSKSASISSQSQNDNGIISVLGANNQFSNNQSNSATQQTPTQQTNPPAPVYSVLPYNFDLPSGWTAGEAQLCPGSDTAKLTTYTNQSRTIVIYQNTRPVDCGGAQAADTYLDYDFSDDGASIQVKTDTIAQCSKQENPACPKGDGKVTVFIGNESADDPTQDVANKLTNKTYFMSITDTQISGDFMAQVVQLSSLPKILTIK